MIYETVLVVFKQGIMLSITSLKLIDLKNGWTQGAIQSNVFQINGWAFQSINEELSISYLESSMINAF